ncbi:hypothetical protein [Leucothrix mucor]|uniref:hypothetical protein n=1 Tax=Leucothrix mucor TaxID=45248 RepID=UPI0003B5EB8E|nr:hypothetical protein [Leucothrix mucor]
MCLKTKNASIAGRPNRALLCANFLVLSFTVTACGSGSSSGGSDVGATAAHNESGVAASPEVSSVPAVPVVVVGGSAGGSVTVDSTLASGNVAETETEVAESSDSSGSSESAEVADDNSSTNGSDQTNVPRDASTDESESSESAVVSDDTTTTENSDPTEAVDNSASTDEPDLTESPTDNTPAEEPELAASPDDSSTTIQVTTGSLTPGYDWRLPASANLSTEGGLVRDTWAEDKPYTQSVFYSIRWDAVYQADGSYDFSEFENWIRDYSHGDSILVRLEVNSRCDTPVSLREIFEFYAGGSTVFWQSRYLSEHQQFVAEFAQRFANDPQIIGVHLGIGDGNYSGIKPDEYTSTTITNGVSVTQDRCDEVDYFHADSGWGEFWMTEADLEHAMSKGFSSTQFVNSVRHIIDSNLSAFAGNEHKLAFTNFGDFAYDEYGLEAVASTEIDAINEGQDQQIVPYVMASGIGNRDGLIEDWLSYNDTVYGMQFEPGPNSSCYLRMDEDFADSIQGRYWGTENEEYGTEDYQILRHGPLETHNYRFLMSSLRALQMRRNYIQIHTPGMDSLPISEHNTPDLLNYLSKTVGRTRADTPDAFVVMGERYIREYYLKGFQETDFGNASLASCQIDTGGERYVQVREFGRWLTEVGGQGDKAELVDLSEFPSMWSVPNYLETQIAGDHDTKKYEYAARRSHEFVFDINDEVVAERCDSPCELEVKLVFRDDVSTTLQVMNQEGVLSTLQTLGDGALKTASFPVSAEFANQFSGGDFGVTTAAVGQPFPVLMTRVNFLKQ